MIVNNTYLGESKIHGIGVFSKNNFIKGDIIEESHFLEVDKNCHCLKNYYFGYINSNNKNALVLGNISFLNHSENPNSYVNYNIDKNIFELIIIKDIKKDQEITIKYGEQIIFKI
jgi:SET domain-containing protein